MLSEIEMLSDDDNAPIRCNCKSNDFLARKLCKAKKLVTLI
jgi:hypothetical protein